MEKLLFQKNIDLNHQLQELLSVNVKDRLNYTLDNEGKRASGTLNIEGDYLYHKQKKHFEDCIEIDILAPFNRLIDHEDFYVEIKDYDYHINQGNLSLDIHINAHGVSKKEDRHILVEEEARYEEIINITQEDTIEKEALIEAIEAFIEEPIEEVQDTKIDEMHTRQLTPNEIMMAEGNYEDIIPVKKNDSEDDLFDDDLERYVTYPFYIAKKEDTYESVSEKYQVDADTLRQINNDKEMSETCIIRLKN